MSDFIEDTIVEQVILITQHDGFKEWEAEQQLKGDGLVIINNSFVFRDVNTRKADEYVAFKILGAGNYNFPPEISSGPRINSDFKYLPANSQLPTTRSLRDAVAEGKKHLGELIFVLIGSIKDDLILTEKVVHAEFDEISWDPCLIEPVNVTPRWMEVRQVHDEDAIWESLVSYYNETGLTVPDGLREAVGVALDKLQQNAAADLTIPKAGESLSEGITEQIVAVLKEQMKQYEAALARLLVSPGDTAAQNEILRLAYNFADDATGYLRFIVSVCDLKPLVLWGTLFHHFNLSEAFRHLPWARSRNKPSMKNYIDTVSDARNSAFHNLFPFRKSLNVRLSNSALAGAELRIFSEHGKKKENVLSYRDKPLVDILTEFTRARERQVTPRFWKQNFEVMQRTIELFEATANFVKTLHQIRAEEQ